MPPTAMYPLFGTSVIPAGWAEPTDAEIEAALDAQPLLASAMHRSPAASPTPDGPADGPGPAPALDRAPDAAPRPLPPGMR